MAFVAAAPSSKPRRSWLLRRVGLRFEDFARVPELILRPLSASRGSGRFFATFDYGDKKSSPPQIRLDPLL